MAQPERYFIGPNVREKLTEVFSRVSGMAAGSGGQTPGVFLQDIQRPPQLIRLCKTELFFAKGTIQTLTIHESGTPPNETYEFGNQVPDVINKYANIATGKFVSVALHGNGRWYVISAECS
jgi:hypothetical protein